MSECGVCGADAHCAASPGLGIAAQANAALLAQAGVEALPGAIGAATREQSERGSAKQAIPAAANARRSPCTERRRSRSRACAGSGVGAVLLTPLAAV